MLPALYSPQIQDMHPGSLRYRVGGVCGNISHCDPALPAQIYIYIVDTRSGFAYELQLWCGVKKLFVDDNLVEQSHVGICDPFPGLFRGGGRIAYKFALGGDFRHVGITHRGGIKEYYFHGSVYL